MRKNKDSILLDKSAPIREDVARGSSCSVYCVRSFEGRGKRCIKRYDKPVSQTYLKLLDLMRAPRGMNVPVVFHWSVSGHLGEELLVEEEWIEGVTLRALMYEAPHKVVLNAMKWSVQLATTLSRLHDAYGFIHHDVKPENVIIDSFEDAVLIDFDSARPLAAVGRKVSAAKADADRIGERTGIKGTRGYAPPEAKLFPGSCDAAVDLYSFGRMFLEIAALEPHSFSPAFYDVMRRCTRIESTSRIESAAGLREALTNLIK
ncbi:MAG: protein kinase [Acidaminobacter sp.]|uniref:protein kinase domain-containing protein n=1 Tax=Acidaminobacter sp. TaxID=1872102 RepID=UPI00137F8594|nr:protein kinase [Acidaminobacter sp.]MZQ99287.1 protein kinase [Acidaminobacter sp.]